MGFGMLGCQCCPSCEAIYPTSQGPSSGTMAGSVYQHISNPAKAAYQTTADIQSTSTSPLFNGTGFSLSPFAFGTGTGYGIGLTWVTPPGPATPYAEVEFTKDSTTVVSSYTDPAWPSGQWTIEVIPTSATTATVNFTTPGGSYTYYDTSFTMADAAWCDLVGVNGKFGGGSTDYIDWITEVL